MPSTDTATQVRERVRRYLSVPVLLLWGTITVLVAAFVYTFLAPRFYWGRSA